MKSARLAILSIALNIFGFLVYTITVTNAAYRKFTLATEILSIMGILNLTLSVVALTKSLRQRESQGARKIAWISLTVAIGMILVIGILLLNIWVYNFRS